MRYKKPLLSALMVGLLLLPVSGAVAAARYEYADETKSVTNESLGDLFGVASTLNLNSTVAGEIFALAGKLDVVEQPERSIFAAAQDITIQKGSGYNTFLAAGTVVLDGEYGNDVYVAASKVTIKETASILGDLRIAASSVDLAGNVDGNVFVYAETMTTTADIGGNLEFSGKSLTFDKGSVAGDVRYTSGNVAAGIDTAEIGGTVTREEPTTYEVTTADVVRAMLVGLLSAALVAGLIVLLAHKRAERTLEVMRDQYGKNLGYGALTLIFLPIVAIILLFTVVAAPIGVLMLLAYVALLIIGSIYGATFFAHWVLSLLKLPLTGSPMWAYAGYAAIGAVVLTFLAQLPYAGGLIGFISFVGLTLPAVGALVTQAWYRGRE